MAKLTTRTGTKEHKVVSPKKWLAARKALLAEEKKFTRLHDRLKQKRRNLPWTEVEKAYVFDGPDGRETLAGLFAGRKRQLIVYHFMFDPDETEGCAHCSCLGRPFRQRRPSFAATGHVAGRGLPRPV